MFKQLPSLGEAAVRSFRAEIAVARCGSCGALHRSLRVQRVLLGVLAVGVVIAVCAVGAAGDASKRLVNDYGGWLCSVGPLSVLLLHVPISWARRRSGAVRPERAWRSHPLVERRVADGWTFSLDLGRAQLAPGQAGVRGDETWAQRFQQDPLGLGKERAPALPSSDAAAERLARLPPVPVEWRQVVDAVVGDRRAPGA